MVSYRLDGIEQLRTPGNSPSISPQTRTIADHIAEIRMTTNEYQHPVAVFDMEGRPVFRNTAMVTRLTAEQRSQSSEPTWYLVFSAACRIFSEAITSQKSISTLIPIRQRLFVILGSLLRQTSGTVYGGTMQIAEVTGTTPKNNSVGFGLDASDRRMTGEESDEYSAWVQRRDEARSKMQRLSPRETEVVGRVSAGLPNKSIASELEISVKTIEKHRANAVRKLGVQSTPEMVRIAVLADSDNRITVPAEPKSVELLSEPVSAVQLKFVDGQAHVD